MADLVDQKATAAPLSTNFIMTTKKKELLSDAMKRTSEWYALFICFTGYRHNTFKFIVK